MESRIEKYFSKHPMYNSVVHAVAGIGIGALLVHSWFDPHPVRFGLLFIGVALLGHVYAYKRQKGKK